MTYCLAIPLFVEGYNRDTLRDIWSGSSEVYTFICAVPLFIERYAIGVLYGEYGRRGVY